jgi:hypothetical protein
MKNGEIFLMVFSLIAQSTLNDVEDILDQIERVRDGKPYALVLIGIEDLQR